MVLLHSTGHNGSCYIETKNLDGETNLKTKQAPKVLSEAFSKTLSLNLLFNPENSKEHVELSCEPPNNSIYKFHGTLKTTSRLRKCLDKIEELKHPDMSIDNENVVLRGMSLKNTE